jgi:hypothetical protein
MTTDRVAKYLFENYYSHYKGDRPDIVPTYEQLLQGFINHSEKFIIILDNEVDENIMGCAVFLTLEDDTYYNIEQINLNEVGVLTELLKENGPNIHFVLLAATGRQVIRRGIELIKQMKHPKTISWWSPDLSKLHRYNLN